MPYTDDQIGPRSLKHITTQTKERYSLILIQHGREPGIDETHEAIIAPCSWTQGRIRSLEMLSAGIDINDIRWCEIPEGYTGSPEEAGDGQPLRPIWHMLWWTVRDDTIAADLDMTIQEFAQHSLERRNA